MAGIIQNRRHGRPGVAVGIAAILTLALASASAAAPGQADLARVRAATAPYHDLATAQAAGYGAFYICTAEPGEGTMGQHFVNLAVLLDTTLDASQPEALVYEPRQDGGYRLVAVEYLVFAEAWDAEHSALPELLGHQFALVPSPNRYGLPPFYELHAWIWQPNPSGMFYEWNPRVSCDA